MPKSRFIPPKNQRIECLALTQTYRRATQDSELDIFDLYYEYKQQWNVLNSKFPLITIRDFESIINSTNVNQLTSQPKINYQETPYVTI